jgi:hypothetical protein
MFKESWYRPALASILENRAETMALAGFGGLQVGLHLLGLPGWACPFKQLFGIPCPGCGLTAATGELLHGQFSLSFHTHAFAPLFLGAFLLMGLALFLPKNVAQVLIAFIGRVETRTGLTAWFLTALMFYWVARLMGFV